MLRVMKIYSYICFRQAGDLYKSMTLMEPLENGGGGK